MKRLLVIGAVLACAGPLALTTPSSRAASPPGGDPEVGPLISGTTSYVDGAYAWTDYVYDDRGPETDSRKGGDATYPADAAPGNAADLVQVQLRRVDGHLAVRAVLNSLVSPDVPSIALGIDTDGDAATGASGLPASGWQVAGRAGIDRVLSLDERGGQLLRHSSGGWVETGTFKVVVDAATNVIQATVPRSLLTVPPEGTWRVVAASGLASQPPLEGGTVYDLAFVRAEDPSTEAAMAVPDAAEQASGQATGRGTGTRMWQDHRQADVLSGHLDVSNAVAAVDLGLLASGATRLARATAPGFHTFLYHSRVRMGEGVQPEPLEYRGVYQPYLVRLPAKSVASPRPLLVFLHGGSGNHLQTASYFAPSLTDVVAPGSFDPPGVVIFPLGRDEGWITGPSERDFLDATEDAVRRLRIDRDRVVVSGISAGATGTQRMGQFYPDRFAGLYSLAGGTIPQLFANFANLPMRMANGIPDPFLGPAPTVLIPPALDELGYVDYRVWLANIRSHVPMQALGNCVYRELLAGERAVDPARVVFVYDPRLDVSDPARGIELRHDRAYWVSRLRPRETAHGGTLLPAMGQYVDRPGEPTPIASIDATSLAHAVRTTTGVSSRSAHENATHGEDFCGPNPSVQTGDSWEESARRVAPAAPLRTSNGLVATMTNLRSAALALPRMSLRVDRPLSVRLSGDGPTSLRLTAPWPGDVVVTSDGLPPTTLTPSGGAVVLSHPGGDRTYRLTARR